MENLRSARGAYAVSEVTKLKLIASAEQAVDRHGVGGVSAREIVRAAGLSNTAAVAYHFGSTDELLRQVLIVRMEELNGLRDRLIANSIIPLSQCDMTTLVEYICLPHVIFARRNGGGTAYQGFVCAYLPHIYPNGALWVFGAESPSSPNMSRIVQEIRLRLAGISDELFNRRMFNMIMLFCNVMRTFPPSSFSRDNADNIFELLGDAISQCVALLSAEVGVPDRVSAMSQQLVPEGAAVSAE